MPAAAAEGPTTARRLAEELVRADRADALMDTEEAGGGDREAAAARAAPRRFDFAPRRFEPAADSDAESSGEEEEEGEGEEET